LKPLSPKKVNKDQLKIKQKGKTEKKDENNKTGLSTSPNVVKTVMLIHQKEILSAHFGTLFPFVVYLLITLITCNIC